MHPSPPLPRPTLAQVRSLARQLPPASRSKLLAELYAAETSAEVREIPAIARAVRADATARSLSPITDDDIARTCIVLGAFVPLKLL